MGFSNSLTHGADGDLACEDDLRSRFDSLLRDGVQRGWSPDEVANAVLSLAQAHVFDTRDVAGGPASTLQ